MAPERPSSALGLHPILARAEVEIYCGESLQAAQRLEKARKVAQRRGLLLDFAVRQRMALLIAAAELTSGQPPRARPIKRAIKLLNSQNIIGTKRHANAIDALFEAYRETPGSLERLAEEAQNLEDAGIPLHAAALRITQALLEGGPEDPRLPPRIQALEKRGIVRPLQWLRLLGVQTPRGHGATSNT